MSTQSVNRRDEILGHAKQLLHSRGFNGFSFRDLALLVGVKSSSIHYHFPTKQDIACALIEEYHADMTRFWQNLAPYSGPERLTQFCQLFIDAALEGEHWCLAGMLASDLDSLDDAVQIALRRFFASAEQWLASQAQALNPDLTEDAAQRRGKSAMALLEGALLLARAQQDATIAQDAANHLMLLLTSK